MADSDRATSKGPFVADLRSGDRVVGFFLVREKRLEPFRDRSKGDYLHLVLTDRTGEITARVWEEAGPLAATFAEGDVVKIAADVAEYQGRPQLVIQRLRRATDDDYDLTDFQPASSRNVASMLAEVRAAVDGLENPHLATLVRAFYDDRAFANQLVRAPGARKVHHAYVGGLLEHVTEMLALAQAVARAYPELNADLLTAGILLHAVGKLDEFTWARDISYSDEGRLLGHLVLASERVAAALARQPDFPPELGLRVRHMLVAQHGRAEWGSPREPQTLEALALHHLENLTAQMGRFRSLLDRHEPGQSWTEYNRLLGRQLYVGGEAASDAGADEPQDEVPLD
jgi:3'-5' exoribonuclease